MNGKVLIVEDEFIVANDLRVILQQAGYKVNGIAASVDEADEFLEKSRPDLVLLDIRLDGKRTGIDFAKKLKAENIAFVYISANSSQESGYCAGSSGSTPSRLSLLIAASLNRATYSGAFRKPR